MNGLQIVDGSKPNLAEIFTMYSRFNLYVLLIDLERIIPLKSVSLQLSTSSSILRAVLIIYTTRERISIVFKENI